MASSGRTSNSSVNYAQEDPSFPYRQQHEFVAKLRV
jgi:hypothetical protein